MISEYTSKNNWYVLFVGTHSIDTITLELERMGYATYCPLEITFVQWKGVCKKVYVPTFGGCIFVSAEWEGLSRLLSEKKISVLVDKSGHPLSISAPKIELMAKLFQLLNL